MSDLHSASEERPNSEYGWQPLTVGADGSVWEWSYRDGQGTRLICGPVERAYIIQQQARIEFRDGLIERLRRVERYAREVMDALERHGPSIVGHLLDTDDNSGEFLRRALAEQEAEGA